MRHITSEEMRQIRSVDLLTYLRSHRPEELVRLPGGEYCTREHGSLKISNGMWHWWSRGVGGTSALDYLIRVDGMTLPEAAEEIRSGALLPPPPREKRKEKKERTLRMPETVRDPRRVREYLLDRGIGKDIIDRCVAEGILLETAEKHEALFLGRDAEGKPRCASLRSTDSSYRGETGGSCKRWPFRITPTAAAKAVRVFESPIDLLSLITMEAERGEDWTKDAWLSLCGVSVPAGRGGVPAALEQFLSDNPSVKEIRLHLDNDPAGAAAAEGIMRALAASDLIVVNDPPLYPYKDVNEQLRYMRREQERRKKEMER